MYAWVTILWRKAVILSDRSRCAAEKPWCEVNIMICPIRKIAQDHNGSIFQPPVRQSTSFVLGPKINTKKTHGILHWELIWILFLNVDDSKAKDRQQKERITKDVRYQESSEVTPDRGISKPRSRVTSLFLPILTQDADGAIRLFYCRFWKRRSNWGLSVSLNAGLCPAPTREPFCKRVPLTLRKSLGQGYG